MPDRLTTEQIREKYPDQWVAMTDVDYKPGSISNFYSAVVVCGMPDAEYPDKRVEFELAGKDYLYQRIADNYSDFIGVML